MSFNKKIITEAIQEVLAENTGKLKTVTGPSGKTVAQVVTPEEEMEMKKKGAKIAPMEEENTSIGHVDDEPGMLKQFAFDTADYAAKLYKLLHHYEQMEDHVDFPNWWQHKVMMAREYISKATHYLEFETMKPQIDAAVDGHSEEELAEDYEPRTKEDLVFQYLRDAWQFGALKGKDVNPDEELSSMADSLLANLPDYDTAEPKEKSAFEKRLEKLAADEKARREQNLKEESLDEAKTYKKGDKLKIKLKNGKKFDVVFDSYSRKKGVAFGKFKDGSGEYDTKSFNLDTIVESVNEAKGDQIAVGNYVKTQHGDIYKRVEGTVGGKPAFVRVEDGKEGKRKTGLHDTAELTLVNKGELNEIKKAEFEKIKPGKELQLRGYGVVKVIENDGIVMKIKDSLDKVHTINLGQYNEKFLKEDEDAEPSKADLKKEKGFAAQSADDQKKAARKKALQPILDKLEKAGTISRVDGKLKVNDMDAYKKAIATINEAVDQVLAESKATCCGKCGRTHVKVTECKKPYLTGKDHCRVR